MEGGDTRSVVIVFILHKNCLFWSVKIIRTVERTTAEIRDINDEEFHFLNWKLFNLLVEREREKER